MIYNKKIKELKYRERWDELAEDTRVIDIEYTREREDIRGLFSWAKIPIVIVLANLILGIYLYPKLPAQISALWGFRSENPYVYKGLWNVFSGVFLQVFVICLVYINYYSMSRSRPEIDPNNPKDSIEFNKRYIKKWSTILLRTLILITLILSYFNMCVFGLVRLTPIFLHIYKFLSYGIIIVNLYMVSKLKMENMVPSVDEIKARQYYFEDDKFWKFASSMYYNPNDPALFVRSRSGHGHTVNVAKPLGMLIVIFSISIVCLAALMIINMDFVLNIVNRIL